MTQDEIIDKDEVLKMAKQAGMMPHSIYDFAIYVEELETFAKLVAAKEREACANVCYEVFRNWVCESDEDVNYPDPNDCIRAIRARGETTSRGEA